MHLLLRRYIDRPQSAKYGLNAAKGHATIAKRAAATCLLFAAVCQHVNDQRVLHDCQEVIGGILECGALVPAAGWDTQERKGHITPCAFSQTR